jgi:hypothetical protein
VAPLDHVVYPSSRPEWITDRSQFKGDPFRVVIVSGPCDTAEESLEELRLMKRAAVSVFVAQIARSEGRFDFFSLSDEQIDRDLITREYAGEVIQGDRTRFEHAVELEFPEAFRTRVHEAWQATEVGHRLSAVGVVTFTGLLALIGSTALTGVLSRRAYRQDASRTKGQ